MTLSFLQGVETIKRHVAQRTNIGEGNCKMRTREAFGVPSSGAGSATISWNQAQDKHIETDPEEFPDHVYVWWTHGSKGFGHVAVLSGGKLYSPGGPDDEDHWYVSTFERIQRGWPKLRLVGWTHSIDGRTPARPVVKPPAPAVKKAKKVATRPRKALAIWSFFIHLKPFGFMDYVAGLNKAAKRKGKRRAIDWDVKVSAEGTGWLLHYGTVAKCGLRDPLGKILGTAKISSLSDAEIARLRSATGKRPRRLLPLLIRAAKLGVRVEVELKAFLPEAALRQIMTNRQIAAMNARGELQFKLLAQWTTAFRWLKTVKAAGGTTILTFTGYKGPGLDKDKWWPVVDFVRSKERWLA